MGRDKGSIRYHAVPQAVHAYRLLEQICGRAYVSTSAEQAAVAPYCNLPLIVDAADHRGPASGLVSGWDGHPGTAWLALAVDMPLVDAALVDELIAGRDVSAPATVFRHPDGTLEPLCAIWEPAARTPLQQQMAAGDASLRRFLQRRRPAVLPPEHPEKLRGANDMAAYSKFVLRLRAVSGRTGF